MKKILFILTILFMLFACSCSNESSSVGIIGGADGPTSVLVSTPGNSENESIMHTYINEAIKHTVNAGAFAADPFVSRVYSASDRLDEKIAQMGSGDYSSPKSVYMLRVSEDGIVNFFSSMGADADADSVKKFAELGQFRLSTLVMNYNGTAGADNLAAVSIATRSEGYIMPADFTQDFALYLEYDGAYSSFTAFEKIGEGVIQATTHFVYNADDGDSVSRFVENFRQMLGEDTVSFEKIK